MTTTTLPPSVTSYRVADPRPSVGTSRAGNVTRMLRDGPPSSVPLTQFASELIELTLDCDTFEVLTPDGLMSRAAADAAYADTIDRLSVRLGQQGCWLVDTDIIVRESDKGYPVALIWVCESLSDDAERIAYWAGSYDLATAGDMLLCVLTPDRAPITAEESPAVRERKLAAVMHAIDRVYWLGEGHPAESHLTRFSDLPGDVHSTRASVLHL